MKNDTNIRVKDGEEETMKQNYLIHFLLVLFPAMLIGILISFLLGMWNEWDTILKWEVAFFIAVSVALVLTVLQVRTTKKKSEKKD